MRWVYLCQCRVGKEIQHLTLKKINSRNAGGMLWFCPCYTFEALSFLADSVEDEFELSTVCHRPEGLDQLQEQTKFTRKELQVLYRGFKNVSWKETPLAAGALTSLLGGHFFSLY